MAPPRYMQLAEALRAGIARGEPPVGGRLPPEVELAERHGVSRHTAREAIRLLTDAKLVARRRGAGTTVIAAQAPHAYVQPLGGVDDLLQYARAARLKVLRLRERRLTGEEARLLGASRSDAWLVVEGLRVADGPPLALSRIYVAAPFAGVAEDLDQGRSVHALLDERFGVAAGRIDQEISAQLLGAREARLLGAEPGGAALRTLRRYHDGGGALILASDSLHPAGRFVYAMSYRREGG